MDKLSFENYICRVSQLRSQCPSLRHGQAAFNVLHSVKPKLAQTIHSTALDPFYNNKVIVPFYEFVMDNWENS